MMGVGIATAAALPFHGEDCTPLNDTIFGISPWHRGHQTSSAHTSCYRRPIMFDRIARVPALADSSRTRPHISGSMPRLTLRWLDGLHKFVMCDLRR
jgi:hypothetical protein